MRRAAPNKVAITPMLKSASSHSAAGQVILHGESYSGAWAHSIDLQKRHECCFVHPFDNPDVITGQGTDVNNRKDHVARFLQTMPRYQHWDLQLVGLSTVLDAKHRATLTSHNLIAQILNDLTLGLG
jgi:hypothetical protein